MNVIADPVPAGTIAATPPTGLDKNVSVQMSGSSLLHLPELRSDWTGRSTVFELIGGYQVQQQQPLAGQNASSTQDARHLYGSAAYRVRF